MSKSETKAEKGLNIPFLVTVALKAFPLACTPSLDTTTMSLEYTNDMLCQECSGIVTLERKKNNTLCVACDCSERSIKVATLLPEGWE